MNLRTFREGDAPKVKSLIVSILKSEFPREQVAYPGIDLDAIPSVYGGPRETFYVAEENGDIIGTAGVKEDSRYTALMRRLFVDPKYRKKGFGSKLADAVIKFCREKGYREVVFRSTGQMKQANELCVKKGFVLDARLDFGGIEILKFTLKLKQGQKEAQWQRRT